MTSSEIEKKISSLTSRSCRTHDRLSSSRLGCNVVVEFLGDTVLDPVLGMGIACVPSQRPHVPLVSQANLIPRRHLEYSAPVASRWRTGTPGRRGELSVDILLNRKAAAALKREAGWSAEHGDMNSTRAIMTSKTHAARMLDTIATICCVLRRPKKAHSWECQPPLRASAALPGLRPSHKQ
jgi:hypothetical protein